MNSVRFKETGGCEMSNCVLALADEQYGGKYVATRSFQDEKVITSGVTIGEVYKKTEEMGIKDPVVFYVPEPGSVHIY